MVVHLLQILNYVLHFVDCRIFVHMVLIFMEISNIDFPLSLKLVRWVLTAHLQNSTTKLVYVTRKSLHPLLYLLIL